MAFVLDGCNVHVLALKAKPQDLASLRATLTAHGAALVEDPAAADLILTALSSPERLAIHVPKPPCPVVSFKWVRDSVSAKAKLAWDSYVILLPAAEAQAGAHAESALTDPLSTHLGPVKGHSAPSSAKRPLSYEEPPRKIQRRTSPGPAPTVVIDSSLPTSDPVAEEDSDAEAQADENESKRNAGLTLVQADLGAEDLDAPATSSYERGLLPTTRKLRYRGVNRDMSSYECCRPHPIDHKNKEVVRHLKILEKHRKLIPDPMRALAYRHAISSLISHPREIKSWEELKMLPFVGDKIKIKMKTYLETGVFPEAEAIEADDEYRVKCMFTEIFGVGSRTANTWYAKGFRTLQDLEDANEEGLIKLTQGQLLGIEYFDDFQQLLTRADVEEMIALVVSCLAEIDPLIQYTPVGGYSRGKPLSGDVDVMITHPDEARAKALIPDIIEKLRERGVLKQILSYADAVPPDSLHGNRHESASQYGMDMLTKYFTVLQQPSTGLHRQVDLIVTPMYNYPIAVIGWTGSTMYERSLRLFVKQKKRLHFSNHGLFDIQTRQRVPIASEEEFFEVTGVPPFPPSLRNP